MDIWDSLWNLGVDLGALVAGVLALAMRWSLVIAWVVFWLWAVNWKKLWPVLAHGAWVPFVLLMVIAAIAWSRLDPTDCTCLGFVTVPNFWWHLGGVSLLMALTFLCGWVQGLFGWEPAELDLQAPVITPHSHDNP